MTITKTTLGQRLGLPVLRLRWAALGDLRSRYWQVFKFSWDNRKTLTPPPLTEDEAAFLPATLALQHMPVSVYSRRLAFLLMAMVLMFIIWALVGKMDIVVTGQGKIIQGGRSKAIASVEVAKVSQLYVQEGQYVAQGAPLLELDSRVVASDYEKSHSDFKLAALQVARSRALLKAMEINQSPQLVVQDAFPADLLRDAKSHLVAQWNDFSSRRGKLKDDMARYGGILPLLKKRAEDYAVLMKTQDVSEHAYLEKKREYLDVEGQYNEAKNQLAILETEFRKNAQDALNEAQKVVGSSFQDMSRAKVHQDLLLITAPVSGTIQQLAVNTVGGVVPAAQTLMFLVPDGAPIEFEAYVENRDIGFVKEGQVVAVKLDAYDYAKYGLLSAKVTHISRDAVDPSTGGAPARDSAGAEGGAPKNPMYALRITMDQTFMDVEGRRVTLNPGMSGSIEIKTGDRFIYEYFLSPLIKHTRESLSER